MLFYAVLLLVFQVITSIHIQYKSSPDGSIETYAFIVVGIGNPTVTSNMLRIVSGALPEIYSSHSLGYSRSRVNQTDKVTLDHYVAMATVVANMSIDISTISSALLHKWPLALTATQATLAPHADIVKRQTVSDTCTNFGMCVFDVYLDNALQCARLSLDVAGIGIPGWGGDCVFLRISGYEVRICPDVVCRNSHCTPRLRDVDDDCVVIGIDTLTDRALTVAWTDSQLYVYFTVRGPFFHASMWLVLLFLGLTVLLLALNVMPIRHSIDSPLGALHPFFLCLLALFGFGTLFDSSELSLYADRAGIWHYELAVCALMTAAFGHMCLVGYCLNVDELHVKIHVHYNLTIMSLLLVMLLGDPVLSLLVAIVYCVLYGYEHRLLNRKRLCCIWFCAYGLLGICAAAGIGIVSVYPIISNLQLDVPGTSMLSIFIICSLYCIGLYH